MFKAIGFIVFLGISLSSSRAQGNELIVGGQVKASQLTGVVTDLDGEPLENVLVTSFDCGTGEFRGARDFKPIEKVASDDRGRFYLRWPKSHMVCLQFQAFGMNLLQIQVKKSLSGEELHPTLTPGT
jgi:hypothetical protein